MGNEWKENRLDTITELIVDCPHSTPKWTESGVIVLRNQYIRNGRIDLSAPSFTNEEHYKKRVKRAVPQSGDLVLTREAPMGEVGQIPEGVKCCLGQRMVLVRADQSKVLPKYLLFSFQSRHVQYQIGWSKGTGTTVSNLRIPYIKALKIPLPPLSEQRRIAHILSTLDDKIALNRQQNATLEAMAQVLFRSWFVDFDPVLDKALAAGHPIPPPLQAKAQRRLELGDRRKPLPAEVAALFPDRFVYHEEVGWVPEGWAVKKISQLGKVITGKTPSSKKPEQFGEEHLFVTPSDFKEYFRVVLHSNRGLSKKGYQAFQRKIVPMNSVLVSCIGSDMGKVLISGKHCLTNQQINSVIPDNEVISTEYLYFFLKNIHSKLRNLALGGSTMPNLNKSTFESINALVPNPRLIEITGDVFSLNTKRVIANLQENQVLSSLRDTLLPKLISGELRVPEAETLIP